MTRTLLIFPHQVCVPEATYTALFHSADHSSTVLRVSSGNRTDNIIIPETQEGVGTPPFAPETIWLIRQSSNRCRIVTFPKLPKGSKATSLTIYLMLQLGAACANVLALDMNNGDVFSMVREMAAGSMVIQPLPKSCGNASRILRGGEFKDPFFGLPTPVLTEKGKQSIAKFVSSRRPAVLKVSWNEDGDRVDAERYGWSPPNKLAETMMQGRTPKFYVIRGPDTAALIALTTWEMRAGRPRDTFVSYLRYTGILRVLHGACEGGLRIAQTRRYRDSINMEDLSHLCNMVYAGSGNDTPITLYQSSDGLELDEERERMVEQCAVVDFQPVSRPVISSWVLEQDT